MSQPFPPNDGVQAQILLAVGEIKTTLAVMQEQLKDVPDHEARIRQLEAGAASAQGGRDTWARVLAGVGLAGGVASAIANFIHH